MSVQGEKNYGEDHHLRVDRPRRGSDRELLGQDFSQQQGWRPTSGGEAFFFQIATDVQGETDPYWMPIVGNGGADSARGWCNEKWGLS